LLLLKGKNPLKNKPLTPAHKSTGVPIQPTARKKIISIRGLFAFFPRKTGEKPVFCADYPPEFLTIFQKKVS
jgi:hypothetical protein